MTYRPSIAERIAWTTALRPADAKVLQALASAGDWETGRRCHPAVRTIVARSRVSRATVTRTLARLRNPHQPGGPWIVMTAWRRRHATTYDICVDRLATHPPKERQVPMETALLATSELKAHNEPSIELEAQNEPQATELEAQNEPPISLPDLISLRTHTPRAREADAPTPDPDLPLFGVVPPPRCAHPHAHAWCEGRVHVPRNLHFEFLDRLGTQPGETPTAKAGRLIAFYADTMAHLAPEASIDDPFAFWNAAYKAWVGTGARRRGASKRRIGLPGATVCPHDPPCTGSTRACIERELAEARAARQRNSA